MAKIYAETSFFSACVSIRTDPIDVGRRMTSENWWKTYARRFELCISREVVRELSDSWFPDSVRLPALGMLMGLDVLELSREVVDFAAVLVDQRVMPGRFRGMPFAWRLQSFTEWITS